MRFEQASVVSREAASKLSPPVVLLVEDEAMVREITTQVLENAGYCVLESSSPREALDLARMRKGKVDLLLTDVVMPGMNGFELADKLRDLKPGLVTIFMTGYAEADARKQVRASATMHIQKPFTIALLLARIAEALHAR